LRICSGSNGAGGRGSPRLARPYGLLHYAPHQLALSSKTSTGRPSGSSRTARKPHGPT